MTGRLNGVAVQLAKACNPFLVAIHCVCHRLALAASDAANSVPWIKHHFEVNLKSLWLFFEQSAPRTASLSEMMRVLKLEIRKMTKVAYTRWLSHDRATNTLRRAFPAVVLCLYEHKCVKNDPLANGLLHAVIDWRFLATLLTFCDVLPLLTKLSLAFQRSDINLSDGTCFHRLPYLHFKVSLVVVQIGSLMDVVCVSL
jgi:hypothetical protein